MFETNDPQKSLLTKAFKTAVRASDLVPMNMILFSSALYHLVVCNRHFVPDWQHNSVQIFVGRRDAEKNQRLAAKSRKS